MSVPTVSFIMAVYNGEEFLLECIAGINAQIFHDYEVVVVDDGSDDGTSKILNQWSKENDRVRVITRKNEGLTSALNLAISQARGKYLARHDADDISSPYRLEKQVHFLDTHSDTVLVGSHIVNFNDSQSLISISSPPDYLIMDALHKGEIPLVHGSILMRKDIFERLPGGYRFKYAQDYDLYLRISSMGRIRIIPEILYAFRNHKSRTTINARELKLHIRKLIMRVNGLVPWDPASEVLMVEHSGDAPLWQVLQNNIIQNTLEDSDKKIDAQYFMSLIGDNLEKNKRTTAAAYAIKAIIVCPLWMKTWLSVPYALIGAALPYSMRCRWRSKSIIAGYRKPCYGSSLNEIFVIK